MMVVDIVMEDGNEVKSAVVFKNVDKGGEAIQDYTELKSHINNGFKGTGMIHFNTKYMSGNIFAGHILTYEVREIEGDHFKGGN